tara:strand:+ start:116 stop:610 length:495 start_codon:yes stop_codon:yes gene_type:complete
MLGVFMRETASGIFILINKKPYTTEVHYLTKERYVTLPELVTGCKVEFDEKQVKLAEYTNCIRCHISFTEEKESQNCKCAHKEIISTRGELIKSEFKPYKSGFGLKVSLKHGTKISHAVLFEGNIMYDIMKKFDVGDYVDFKAFLISANGDNDLVKLFYVKNFK